MEGKMAKTYNNDDVEKYGTGASLVGPPSAVPVERGWNAVSRGLKESASDAMDVIGEGAKSAVDWLNLPKQETSEDGNLENLQTDSGYFRDTPEPKESPISSQSPIAEAGVPLKSGPSTAIAASGPRYKRVGNPYESAAPGYGSTKMIATREGAIQDLSKQAVGPQSSVPGFNNQDLVDLFGGPAKSSMTPEEAGAQIAKNKGTMPDGFYYDRNAKGTADDPFVKQMPTGDNYIGLSGNRLEKNPHSSVPQLDFSNPQALLASAVPMAAQIGQNKARQIEAQRQAQLWRDKYNIDLSSHLKNLEMQLQAPKIAAETELARAQSEKARREIPEKDSTDKYLKLALDNLANIKMNKPDLTDEQAKALAVKDVMEMAEQLRNIKGQSAAKTPSSGITPEMARQELARRKQLQAQGAQS